MKFWQHFYAKIDLHIRLHNLRPIFGEIFSENWPKFSILLSKNDDCKKINSCFQFGINEDENKWLLNLWFLKTSEAQKLFEVVCIKKYWRRIYSIIYAFIVLEDQCESLQPWPSYSECWWDELSFFFWLYSPCCAVIQSINA